MTKLPLFGLIWFVLLSATAAAGHTHTDAALDIHKAVDPLLNSGSLVIASLLLLIAVLLAAVVALYRDNKSNNAEMQDLSLRTLQVLTDLDKTIEANTQARLATHG